MLSPDPHPLSMMSTDKNQFLKKLAQSLGPNNPWKTECFRALCTTKTMCTSCLLKIKSIKFNLFKLIDDILRRKMKLRTCGSGCRQLLLKTWTTWVLTYLNRIMRDARDFQVSISSQKKNENCLCHFLLKSDV